MPEIVFSEKTPKHEIFNHLYFGPNFVISGTALGCVFFFFFLTSVNHGARHFYSTPLRPCEYCVPYICFEAFCENSKCNLYVEYFCRKNLSYVLSNLDCQVHKIYYSSQIAVTTGGFEVPTLT